MGITDFFAGQDQGKMNWGEANGLWSVANFKIIGVNIMEIFIAQAVDADLKKALNYGVEILIIPHIEKIQKFMHKEGLQAPTISQRPNLDIIGKKIEPNTFVKDPEIAKCTRETFRRGLSLDMRGYTDSSRDDVRSLFWDILNDDYKGYEMIMKLIKSKNWLIAPSTV